MSAMSLSTGSTTVPHTLVAVASPTASAMSMGSHGGMGGGSGCKISMLWNWTIIDSCFLAKSWHIRSKAMFAGSCIGIVLLVIALEFLRRLGKEYDRRILANHQRRLGPLPSPTASEVRPNKNGTAVTSQSIFGHSRPTAFKPSFMQQAIRAMLHTLAFAVAYFVMLLAMYYNGYIIIAIFIGAFLGFFIFGWESISLVGPQEETTVCCG